MAEALKIFKPELWSRAIMTELDVITSLRKHNDYSFNDEIQYGKKLHITKAGDTQIRAYTQGVDITFDEVDGTEIVLVIDQQRYFGKYYDDIDKVQAIPNAVQVDMRETAKALAEDADEFVSARLYQAVVNTDPTKPTIAKVTATMTKAGVIDAIEKALVKLYENNVTPTTALYGEFSPAFYSLLRQSLTELSTNNPELLKKGAIGRYNMVDIYIENKLPVKKNSSGTDGIKYNFIRTGKAFAYAEQIDKVASVAKEKGFGTYFKGLMVYGGIVARPEQAMAIEEPVANATDSAWLAR